MLSAETTHDALTKTVEDLTQWLSAVEIGLTGLLDKLPLTNGTDTIEEEAEQDDSMTDVEEEEELPQDDAEDDDARNGDLGVAFGHHVGSSAVFGHKVLHDMSVALPNG